MFGTVDFIVLNNIEEEQKIKKLKKKKAKIWYCIHEPLIFMSQ